MDRAHPAERLAESILGVGHYLDVDPPRKERPKYGIAEDVGGGGTINRYQVEQDLPADNYESAIVEEN